MGGMMRTTTTTKEFPISHQERCVLKQLAEYEGYRTTREIAENSCVSWQTAYNFLVRLKKQGWINYHKQGKWEYWKAVFA